MKAWLKRNAVAVVLFLGAMLLLAACWPPRCRVEVHVTQE